MGTYELALEGDPKEKLDQLKKAAKKRGVHFRGDVDSGSFSGRGLRGSYQREGESVVVTITSTPFFLSESKIVRELKRFLR